MIKAVLVFFLLLTAPMAHASLFQCFYEDGTSTYSDNNCPEAVAQVDLSLKGSWMMRKPKGTRCQVRCNANRCACSGVSISLSSRKDAVLKAMDKLPKAHMRQRSALSNCRKCPRSRRRSVAVNACDVVLYQSVIKKFYRGVSERIVAQSKSSKIALEKAQRSCDGPGAAAPKSETPYGEKLSCKQQSAYRTAVTFARLTHQRAQREIAQLTAGATVLELSQPKL